MSIHTINNLQAVHLSSILYLRAIAKTTNVQYTFKFQGNWEKMVLLQRLESYGYAITICFKYLTFKLFYLYNSVFCTTFTICQRHKRSKFVNVTNTFKCHNVTRMCQHLKHSWTCHCHKHYVRLNVLNTLNASTSQTPCASPRHKHSKCLNFTNTLYVSTSQTL
jgi:hypothetical protein